jgi:phytoene synthase
VSTQDTGAICLNMLRDLDRDRYLACLLSPEDKRPALAALYAFNAEIARIRDAVREPLPGEVRMQWWRDLLEGNAHGDSQANPVAAGFMDCVEKYRLPRPTLINLLEARIFDLYDDPFEDRNALEGYAGETASAIIQLASLILDPQAAAGSADAAGHAGVAQAMAGMMLLAPLHRRRGQVYIPVDILSATGLNREAFLAGEDKDRITAAIDIFCAIALDHLGYARKTKVDAACFPAYLPVAMTETVLKKAKRAGASLFEDDIQPSLVRRQWLMTKSVFLKRF